MSFASSRVDAFSLNCLRRQSAMVESGYSDGEYLSERFSYYTF